VGNGREVNEDKKVITLEYSQSVAGVGCAIDILLNSIRKINKKNNAFPL